MLSVWLISFAIHFSTRFRTLLVHPRRLMGVCRVCDIRQFYLGVRNHPRTQRVRSCVRSAARAFVTAIVQKLIADLHDSVLLRAAIRQLLKLCYQYRPPRSRTRASETTIAYLPRKSRSRAFLELQCNQGRSHIKNCTLVDTRERPAEPTADAAQLLKSCVCMQDILRAHAYCACALLPPQVSCVRRAVANAQLKLSILTLFRPCTTSGYRDNNAARRQTTCLLS